MEQEEINEQLKKTFARLSEKHSVPEKNMQIMLHIEGEALVCELFNDQKVVIELDIRKDILGIKSAILDPFNKAGELTFFLANSIVKYSNINKFNHNESFLTISHDVANGVFRGRLCNQQGKCAELTLQDIFKQEAII
jgi:hypothetical protein